MEKKLLSCTRDEKGRYVVKVQVSPAEFANALQQIYEICKPELEIEGVEKGQATREQAEAAMGQDFFYPQAAQHCCVTSMNELIEEEQLDVVGYPDITECSTNAEGLTYTAVCDAYPEVKLGNYKKIRVHIPQPQVEDAEVELLLEEYARRAGKENELDRPAQNGDTVRIDLEGTLEGGTPLPGGHAENYAIVLGSKTFLPDLEAGIVGMKAGEKRDVTLTFPMDYTVELAGKNVTFHVTMNAVCEILIPTVDEAFAREYFDCSLEELRAGVRESILEDKLARHRVQVEDNVLSQATGMMDCTLPESMILKEMDTLTSDFCDRLEKQGTTLEKYLEEMKMSEADYDQTARASAVHRLRQEILPRAVAREENIVLDDETLNKTAEFLAEQYGATAESVRDALTREMLEREALRQIVVDLILEK